MVSSEVRWFSLRCITMVHTSQGHWGAEEMNPKARRDLPLWRPPYTGDQWKCCSNCLCLAMVKCVSATEKWAEFRRWSSKHLLEHQWQRRVSLGIEWGGQGNCCDDDFFSDTASHRQDHSVTFLGAIEWLGARNKGPFKESHSSDELPHHPTAPADQLLEKTVNSRRHSRPHCCA